MCTARQQDKSFLTELTGSSVDPLHDQTARKGRGYPGRQCN